MDSALTKILLRNVDVTVRVGLAPWERQRPQRLLVNVELQAEPSTYLRVVTPQSMIDYVPIYQRIQSWRARPHVDLIETLVSELLELSFEDPRVDASKVSVVKTEVLDQAEAAGAEAFMTRRDYNFCFRHRLIPGSFLEA